MSNPTLSKIKTKTMPVFKTPINGYSIHFSHFYEHRLAFSTSQNFGILGNGRLHVLVLSPSPTHPPITELISFDTADGIYDLTWSKSYDSLLVAAIAEDVPICYNPCCQFQCHL